VRQFGGCSDEVTHFSHIGCHDNFTLKSSSEDCILLYAGQVRVEREYLRGGSEGRASQHVNASLYFLNTGHEYQYSAASTVVYDVRDQGGDKLTR